MQARKRAIDLDPPRRFAPEFQPVDVDRLRAARMGAGIGIRDFPKVIGVLSVYRYTAIEKGRISPSRVEEYVLTKLLEWLEALADEINPGWQFVETHDVRQSLELDRGRKKRRVGSLRSYWPNGFSAERLRGAMQKSGMTNKDIGEWMNTSPAIISGWARGKGAPSYRKHDALMLFIVQVEKDYERSQRLAKGG